MFYLLGMIWEKKMVLAPNFIQLYRKRFGVPIVAQWKRIPLGTMRLQVQSLALFSGLRIRRHRKLWCRSKTWLGSFVAVAVM